MEKFCNSPHWFFKWQIHVKKFHLDEQRAGNTNIRTVINQYDWSIIRFSPVSVILWVKTLDHWMMLLLSIWLLIKVLHHESHLQLYVKMLGISTTNIKLFNVNNKTPEKLWNMLKGNNKDTRTTSLTSFCCLYCKLWKYLTFSSSVAIVDFEHITVCWV